MTDEISLLYSGNDSYSDAFTVSILSAAMNIKSPLHLYMLSGDFSDYKPHFNLLKADTMDRILAAIAPYKSDVHYTILDCRSLFDECLAHGRNAKTTYSPYSLLRLLIDRMDLPDRVYYLDGDALVLRDISDAFHMDLKGNALAMVQDAAGHHWFGPLYCNSGSILFDVKKIKEDGTLEKTRKFVNRLHLFMPDQTAINATFKHNTLILPRAFNEQRKQQEDTYIRHYCKIPKFLHFDNVKPWNIAAFRDYYGDEAKDIIDAYEKISEKVPK